MSDPLAHVREWFEEAAAAGLVEAEADGARHRRRPTAVPSVRIVLLKGIDDAASVLHQLRARARAASWTRTRARRATLYWQPLQRQVRIEGAVERLTAAESDAYFASRPRGAQLGAWASAQGTVLRDRAVLEERVREVEERYPDEVPRPEYWGGYRLVRTRSSSGRAAPTGCTTASTSCASRTAPGAPSACRRSSRRSGVNEDASPACTNRKMMARGGSVSAAARRSRFACSGHQTGDRTDDDDDGDERRLRPASSC